MKKYIVILVFALCLSAAATIYYYSCRAEFMTTTCTIEETPTQIEVDMQCRLVGLIIDDEQAVLRTHWFGSNVLKIYQASYEIGCDLQIVDDWYHWADSGTSVDVELPDVEILHDLGVNAGHTIDVYGTCGDAAEMQSMLREAEVQMRDRAMTEEHAEIARNNVELLVRGLFYTLPADSVRIEWL